MIKIGVVGLSGRVSKVVIEEITKRSDCTLSGIFVRSSKMNENSEYKLYDDIKDLASNSDAIIDFSNPENSLAIANQLINSKVLLVSGTTGFTPQEFEEFKNYSDSFPIIWSANMSIGINLLHSLLKIAAPRLGVDFDAAIIDIHHRHKKDSPSGTALSLAKTIETAEKNAKVQISSLRLGEEFGSHEIIFSGAHESVSFTHKSFSRNSYAIGAIEACIWGVNKTSGFYSMQDVL